MILSGTAIRQRLSQGQIFKKGTWNENSIKEASYALRVASDGLLLGGKRFKPGKDFVGDSIKIRPGEIAILSTVERLDMPPNLVGKLGIRFDFASQGLTGLMGIQVDPYFGWGHDDERLYIRVANLGNEPVPVDFGADLFTFELHELKGDLPRPSSPRIGMWHRLQDVLGDQDNASWSFVTRVQDNVEKTQQSFGKDWESARAEMRDHLQPLVLFGVFLLAVTILGVALSVIVAVRNTPEVYVPSWVTEWGWWLLLGTLSAAAVATAVMGAATAIVGGLTAWRHIKGR